MVGLGNPGKEFAGTRHNVGAEAVTTLAQRHQARLKSERGLNADVCEVGIGGHRVLVAVPRTYMNESGRAVAPLVRRSGIDQIAVPPGTGGDSAEGGTSSRLIIVHDELDLPTGRLRIKSGGGTAGNYGLKSIDSHLHTNDYLRLRIGIGKPPTPKAGAGHVLKRPGSAERNLLSAAIEGAADAIELVVTEGVAHAMNQVNRVE